MTGIVYHGLYGSGGRAVVVESHAGAHPGALAHKVRHSPTGFSWGYAGSGPADLARCLLLAAAGGEARCPACDGGGHVEMTDDGTEQPATTGSDPERVLPCLGCDEAV